MPDLTPAEFKTIKEGSEAAKGLVESHVQGMDYLNPDVMNKVRAIETADKIIDSIYKSYKEHSR